MINLKNNNLQALVLSMCFGLKKRSNLAILPGREGGKFIHCRGKWALYKYNTQISALHQ